jgi:membrane protein
VRLRLPLLDHGIRAGRHYTRVLGNQHAGAATYFGFLSLFPLVALAYAAVGYVLRFSPDAEQQLTDAITAVLPGVVGTGPNQLNLQSIADNATSVGIVGVVGLLYAGLGVVAALRQALRAVWRVPPRIGKFVQARFSDAGVLVVLGLGALASIGVSSSATSLADRALRLVDLEGGFESWLLRLMAVGLAVATNFGLLLLVYLWLPGRRLPVRDLLGGTVLGAIALEVLTLAGTALVGYTASNKLYGTFAVLVGLLVYLNLVFRSVLLAGAWIAVGAGIVEVDPPVVAVGVDAGPRSPAARAAVLLGVVGLVGVRRRRVRAAANDHVHRRS